MAQRRQLTPAALKRIQLARARTRRHVWAQLPALPASEVTGTDLDEIVVLDVDATLVTRTVRGSQLLPRLKAVFTTTRWRSGAITPKRCSR